MKETIEMIEDREGRERFLGLVREMAANMAEYYEELRRLGLPEPVAARMMERFQEWYLGSILTLADDDDKGD